MVKSALQVMLPPQCEGELTPSSPLSSKLRVIQNSLNRVLFLESLRWFSTVLARLPAPAYIGHTLTLAYRTYAMDYHNGIFDQGAFNLGATGLPHSEGEDQRRAASEGVHVLSGVWTFLITCFLNPFPDLSHLQLLHHILI